MTICPNRLPPYDSTLTVSANAPEASYDIWTFPNLHTRDKGTKILKVVLQEKFPQCNTAIVFETLDIEAIDVFHC